MEVTINDKTIPVPESWNDLTLQHQLFIYAVLMTDSKNLFEPQELLPAKRILIVQALLNVDVAFMKKWEADCIAAITEDGGSEMDGRMIFHSELGEVLHATDFLFEMVKKEKEDEPDRYQVKLGLTRCPYTWLSFKRDNGEKRFWYSPEDGLENITIYEMGVTFTLFEKFMKTKDETIADKLLATIYRPQKPVTKENKQSAYDGDKRLPFLHHELMVKKRIKRIQLIPKPCKQLLIFWFASCRHKIISSYPNIFNAPQGDQGGNQYGWGGVLLSLADGLVNLDAISKQKYSNALTYLSFLEDQRKLKVLRNI